MTQTERFLKAQIKELDENNQIGNLTISNGRNKLTVKSVLSALLVEYKRDPSKYKRKRLFNKKNKL